MKANKPKTVIPVDSPALNAFNAYLKAMSTVLLGVNYVTHFEAKAFDLPGSHFSVSKIMLLAYPDSKPNEAPIKECSLEVLLESVDHCFSYSSSILKEDKINGDIIGQLRLGFWSQLRNCIDYQNATFYSYLSDVGLPRYDIYWQFSWLIHNASQDKCLFLYGGSTD